MRVPTLEVLEVRQLLSSTLLGAGQVALLDLDGNGTKDGVLVNNGPVAITYEIDAGALAAVNLTGDGARFTTNLPIVGIGDTSLTDDFLLDSAKVGVAVRYRSVLYPAVAGTTGVVAGAINRFEVGVGGLTAQTIEGGIGTLILGGGNLGDVASAGGIAEIKDHGDILGAVSAVGDIGLVSARRLAGSVSSSARIVKLAVDEVAGTVVAASIGQLIAGAIDAAYITVGGNMERLAADTITGNARISIGGNLQQLRADTISAGVNAGLGIAVGGRLETIRVGLLEGGQAVGDYTNDSVTALGIGGSVGTFHAGLISGGSGSGGGAWGMLTVSVGGDVERLQAAAMTGGRAADGGVATLDFSVSGDLISARVGRILGAAAETLNGSTAVGINVGHDIRKLVVGEINGGPAVDDVPDDGYSAVAGVAIYAGNDILELAAHRISGGTASGYGAGAVVYIFAGRDIDVISANSFSGGAASGEFSSADVVVQAMRNVNFIGAGAISGTQRDCHVCDPTVNFIAGGDIGTVVAGQITGGTVTSDGVSAAVAGVLLRADGTYVDPETGEDVLGDGNIGAIYVGTIRGGTASGAGALAFVDISAAGDINRLWADCISGGRTADGGHTYVSILAGHDLVDFYAGTILGSENAADDGDGLPNSEVVIRAVNDIQSFLARRIIAGGDGAVTIEAGDDIETMAVNLISGEGGLVSIAAGGDIVSLSVERVVLGGDGDISIAAGGDMTLDVARVRDWGLVGADGLRISAAGEVTDVRGTLTDFLDPVDVADPA